MKNEKTSARVAKIAARYLPMSLAAFTLAARRDPKGVLKDMKALAGTAETQRPDKERRYNPDVPQPWVDQPGNVLSAADKNANVTISGRVDPTTEAAYKIGFAAGKRQAPLKVDRQPAPKRRPYEHPYDDESGFDPRDGGKVGKQQVPDSKASRKRVTGPARIKSANSRPWPPSAKPPKHGP